MTNILSAIEAIGGLFGGYGLVTLGPVVLQSMEVPDKITTGGDQHLVVHKKPGGQRTIDAMGRDDADISWSGILQGENAESRMHALDGLRQSGFPIVLAFGTSSFTVVVHRFRPDYHRANWIPYRISCTVSQDNAAVFEDLALSLLGSLLGDLGSAGSLGLSSAASVAVAAAQAAVGVSGALVVGSAAYVSAASALGSAQSVLAADAATATGSLSTVINSGSVLGVTQVENAPAAFAGVLSAAGSLANSVQAGAFVGRAAVNLSNAGA